MLFPGDCLLRNGRILTFEVMVCHLRLELLELDICWGCSTYKKHRNMVKGL